MHVTHSTGDRYNDDEAGAAAKDENPAAADTEASNDNVYSELQQPFAPIAGAVGGVGGEDVCSEPFAMY